MNGCTFFPLVCLANEGENKIWKKKKEDSSPVRAGGRMKLI